MVEQTTASEETVIEAENSAPTEAVEEQEAIKFDDILNFVDEDVRTSKVLEPFKGKVLAEVLPQFVKNYVHAQTLTGKKLANFSESEIREFISLPTKPESAEGYNTIEDVDMEFLDKFKDVMYDMGLDSGQAKKFVDIQKQLIANQDANSAEHKQKLADAVEDTLHEKFGLNFRKAMDLAQQAAQNIGGEEMVNRVFKADVKDPQLIEMFYKVGKEMGIGTVTPKGVPASEPDPEVTKRSLLTDPEFMAAYKSAMHPKHAEAVEKMKSLYMKA